MVNNVINSRVSLNDTLDCVAGSNLGTLGKSSHYTGSLFVDCSSTCDMGSVPTLYDRHIFSSVHGVFPMTGSAVSPAIWYTYKIHQIVCPKLQRTIFYCATLGSREAEGNGIYLPLRIDNIAVPDCNSWSVDRWEINRSRCSFSSAGGSLPSVDSSCHLLG